MANASDEKRILVFSGVDRETLTTLLEQGFDVYVEWAGIEKTAQILLRELSTLALSTTTRTAFRALNGVGISELMARRGLIEAARAAEIGGAIQEALANAIVHGNLALNRSCLADDDDFVAFHREIARRIECAEALDSRIMIDIADARAEVVVRISDQGAGFDPAGAKVQLSASSGRGLHIMRSRADRIHFEGGGRVAALTFLKSRQPIPSSCV